MTAGRFVLLGLLAVAAAFAWWLVPGGDAGAGSSLSAPPLAAQDDELMELPGVDPPERDVVPLTASTPAVAVAADVASPEPPAEPPIDVARLDVFVRAALDGAPVAGVRVGLLPLPGWPGDDLPAPALTDVDGRARFEVAGPLRAGGLRVAAGRDTGGVTQAQQVGLRVGDRRTLELLAPPCDGLAGVVVDVHDVPVPGARVLAWSRRMAGLDAEQLARGLPSPDAETLSDGAGRFRLACVGPDFVLAAEADGRVCQVRVRGSLPEGARWDDLRLVLGPPVSLDGTVTWSDGRPAPGVRIVATGRRSYGPMFLTDRPTLFTADAPPAAVTSDAKGAFRFDALTGQPWTFSSESPDAAPVTVTHDPRDGPLHLQLDAGVVLSGEVRGADGETLSGASVRVTNGPNTARATRTDADGRFRMGGLAADARIQVLALADGHAPAVATPRSPSPGEPPWVSLSLPRALPLDGRVVDVAGEPIPGAGLQLDGGPLVDAVGWGGVATRTVVQAWGLDAATTTADGRFALAQLPPGPFQLEVVHPDDPALRRRFDVTAGARDLELVLDDGLGGVVLRGVVRDAMSGAPVPVFDVYVHRKTDAGDFDTSRVSFRDDMGRFQLTDLEPGELIVMVVVDGYRNGHRPEAHYDVGEHVLDMELLPVRSLSLRCLDEHGAPVHRASVMAVNENGGVIWVQVGDGASSTSLSTDEHGEVDVHGLPASVIDIQVHVLGRDPKLVGRAQFDLRQPLPGRRDIVLRPEDG